MSDVGVKRAIVIGLKGVVSVTRGLDIAEHMEDT